MGEGREGCGCVGGTRDEGECCECKAKGLGMGGGMGEVSV